MLFIAANVGFYEFGWRWARGLFPSGPPGEFLDHPAILLGGPALALALNLPHLIGLKRRSAPHGALVEGVYVARRPGSVAAAGSGAACLAVLVGNATLENLSHMVRDAAG